MATVLLYHVTGLKEAQLRLVCESLRINVRSVMESELHLPIGRLVGCDVSGGDIVPSSFDGEMLVMAHFSQALLDRFLQTYRQAGIEPVPLKAILTEHNQNWSSVALYRELQKENTLMLKKLERG